jgi:hypothetical protein
MSGQSFPFFADHNVMATRDLLNAQRCASTLTKWGCKAEVEVKTMKPGEMSDADLLFSAELPNSSNRAFFAGNSVERAVNGFKSFGRSNPTVNVIDRFWR